MRTYSPFFQTLYDEQEPVGTLGRGTHYSILRAIVFHDEDGKIIPCDRYRNAKSNYHDFAIIWDEDHDTRVINVIEKIYQEGLLPCFSIFGERKAGFSALFCSERDDIPLHIKVSVQQRCEETISNIYNDVWHVQLGTLMRSQGIINANDEDIVLYLKNINMLWKLGSKPIIDNSQRQD